MRIDTKDGTVEFANGRVSAAMCRSEFLQSPLGRSAELVVENAPYVTYRIHPETGVGATLQFRDEKLLNLGWAIIMPGETDADWSVDSEMRRKHLHEEWLLKELGNPPYRFSWGRVVSDFDAKGVSSAIIAAYAR